MSGVRLSEGEREALANACDAAYDFGDAWIRMLRNGLEDMLLPVVEGIIAARLAAACPHLDQLSDRTREKWAAEDRATALTARLAAVEALLAAGDTRTLDDIEEPAVLIDDLRAALTADPLPPRPGAGDGGEVGA